MRQENKSCGHQQLQATQLHCHQAILGNLPKMGFPQGMSFLQRLGLLQEMGAVQGLGLPRIRFLQRMGLLRHHPEMVRRPMMKHCQVHCRPMANQGCYPLQGRSLMQRS